MTANNLLAWCLQIAVLVAAAGLAAFALRLGTPRARLLYWQLALALCLALPWLQPWKQETIPVAGVVSTVSSVLAVHGPGPQRIPWKAVMIWLLAAGILMRGVWLAVGFWKLGHYRRQSRWLGFRDGATLRISAEISSPVTFGAFRPVVLLPVQFEQLAPAVQEAILCHELLHVRRKDWLFTVAEEIVRALFWFHPAIWWLLGEIGLAREQEVDRQVVQRTNAREEYVDALLAIAGARPQLDLAPAPLFLRKRHLKQRVVSVLKEVRMSKTRLVSSLAAAVGGLAAAAWLVTASFPLTAAGAGGNIIHAIPPAGIQVQVPNDTVFVQAKVDEAGEVLDAAVLAGPDKLRRAALQIVLISRLSRSDTSHMEQVSVVFDAAGPSAPIRVGGNVQAAKIRYKAAPVYPLEAKQAGVQGVVELHALIGKDGAIENLSIISGDPLLVPSALDAVRRWVYEPTLLNFDPVEVDTQINVNYTLVR